MLCYIHQLVANFVCRLFGTGQVVYSGFDDTDQSAESEAKQWGSMKRSIELRETVELVRVACEFVTTNASFHIYVIIWSTVNMKLLINLTCPDRIGDTNHAKTKMVYHFFLIHWV